MATVLPARPAARWLLLGTLLASIGQGMTLPFLFVYLHEVRHLDSGAVGLVVAWIGLLALVLGGPSGSLIDRFGVRRVALPMYLLGAAGVAGYALVHSTGTAFAAATLAAVDMAVLWPAQNTLLASIVEESDRQRVFGLSFAILNLGIGSGGLLAGFLVDIHRPETFERLYVVNGVMDLAPAAILLTLRGVGGPPGERAQSERSDRSGGAGPSAGGYREVFANRAFRRFVWFGLVLSVCGYAQIEVGYPAFSTLVGGVSARVVAWGLAANTLVIVLAQLFVLRRLEGRSRSRGLAAVGVVFALAWVLLGLGAWGRSLSPALPVLGVILCASVFAAGETIMSPVLPAITNALASDELRGRYNAMNSMIYGVTAVVGPLTAAPLIGHHLGAVWIGLIVGGSLLASAVALSLHRLLTPEQDGRVPAASSVGPLRDDQALSPAMGRESA